MKRYTLWFSTVAAAFVLFAGCQSENAGPRVGDPDKTEVGRISLEEKQMSATLIKGNLEQVRLPNAFARG